MKQGSRPRSFSRSRTTTSLPPIATLSKIASFFDVRMVHFFAEEEECTFEVVRSGERTIMPRVISEDGSSHGYFFESLSVRKKNKKMDSLSPYSQRAGGKHLHLHRECRKSTFCATLTAWPACREIPRDSIERMNR